MPVGDLAVGVRRMSAGPMRTGRLTGAPEMLGERVMNNVAVELETSEDLRLGVGELVIAQDA